MNKGGPRSGAGLAKDTSGAKAQRHTVTLDAVTVERMKTLGTGNLSRGIREAARRLADNDQVQAGPAGVMAGIAPGTES